MFHIVLHQPCQALRLLELYLLCLLLVIILSDFLFMFVGIIDDYSAKKWQLS